MSAIAFWTPETAGRQTAPKPTFRDQFGKVSFWRNLLVQQPEELTRSRPSMPNIGEKVV
jgi:hypothetical protein